MKGVWVEMQRDVRGSPHSGRGEGTAQRVPQELLSMIPRSLKEMSGEKQVEFAEEVAKRCKDVSKSRMRTIYAWVRKSRLDLQEAKRKADQPTVDQIRPIISDIKLLKAKLAYLAGRGKENRDERDQMNNLYEILCRVIDAVSDEQDLEAFFSVVESILAYHRYYSS
ncbi:MAG: type III-A CRISPR-associated protein Csm2 [Methanomassiliicoccales archaeon]|nr:type III-A CRISPR-associated protein Csm2 [Methanomassiliicoccales archaeon]